MTNDSERIRGALSFLSPDCDRDTWVRMGMAVKSELGEEGFDIWDAWSQQGESYNTRDARDAWRSIKANGEVTIATLFHEAKAQGWVNGSHTAPTPDEIAERKRVAEQRTTHDQAEIERERAQAAARAQEVWNAATQAQADNPYLSRKQVAPVATLREIDAGAIQKLLGCAPQSGGDLLEGRVLVVPVKQGERLSTLELIAGDGRKAALAGRGTKVAGYWAAQRLPDGNGDGLTLLIGEGVATVLSAKEASGQPSIAALSAGNLTAVAKAMRERYPTAALVILADLVKKTGEPDPRAIEAARSVGGLLAVPDFGSERPDGATDFNDMAALRGLEGVKQAVTNATAPARGKPQPVEGSPPRPVYGSRGEEDGGDRHANQPKPDHPSMLYGLVGDVGRTAARDTEVNAFAAAAGFLSFLSAMVGRDVYLPVGNTWHHPRLFTLHVGRSGRGRKGDALALVHRIRHALDQTLLGQVHVGGLSTREGLALLIHDGYTHGKDEVAPIEDKRLWVVESEFANVLHQGKRDGNTLSPALRDAWDGVAIRPATKWNRIWASDPHVAMAAGITPSELRSVITTRELTNGFANRFLMFWAERPCLVVFPKPTGDATVTELAERSAAVIRYAKGGYPFSKDIRRMSLKPDATRVYEQLYRTELNCDAEGELLTALLERRAPMLLRIAMLFALTDETLTIGKQHIEAAAAWVRYWQESVRFVFGEMGDAEGAVERREIASAVVAYIKKHGEVDRTDLMSKCFKGHVSKDKLDEALQDLLAATPPRIEVIPLPRSDGQAGRGRKVYRLLSSVACEVSEHSEDRLPEPIPLSSHGCEVGEISFRDSVSSDLTSQSSQSREVSGPRVDSQSSLTSQSSQPHSYEAECVVEGEL